MSAGSITQPTCIHCGSVRESFTGDPCQCPGAKERRAAWDADKDTMKDSKPTATIAPPLPVQDDGLADAPTRQAAKEQANAAQDEQLDRPRAGS